jgi:hypothetical protein
MTIAMPLFETFFISEISHGSKPKILMQFRMHDIFLQQLHQLDKTVKYLSRIENIEIINRFAFSSRFETVFRK